MATGSAPLDTARKMGDSLAGQEVFYGRWKKSHQDIDIILRQDLLDMESVRSISESAVTL